MTRSWLRLLGIAILAAILATPAGAEEVRIEIQGLTALGNLEIAQGRSLKTDGVVLLLHEELSHNRMEVISALQELLRERGINSLAITLTLGLNERRGLFNCRVEQDHRNEDAIIEIAAWVDWLKEQGASRITLAGHSRGGNQVAVYAAKDADKAVNGLVLIAPIADTAVSLQNEYGQRFDQPLPPILAEAEKFVSEDRSSTLLAGVPFLVCRSAGVTAGAFVNYYGPNQNLYTPSLLPHIQMPILVVVGELDPLANELLPAVQGIPGVGSIAIETVSGADHFFRDLTADTLADRIKTFVDGLK
ncbi:MAG: alpha/beta hydrolase [Rhodomicrobiaceae bacterium]